MILQVLLTVIIVLIVLLFRSLEKTESLIETEAGLLKMQTSELTQ